MKPVRVVLKRDTPDAASLDRDLLSARPRSQPRWPTRGSATTCRAWGARLGKANVVAFIIQCGESEVVIDASREQTERRERPDSTWRALERPRLQTGALTNSRVKDSRHSSVEARAPPR